MATRVHKLGAGTITVGTVPLDFSAEVKNVVITSDYEETSEAVTYLDGSSVPATEERTDGVKAECDNDLTAAGVYSYCHTNDGAVVPFTFTPNTADAAEWAGDVKIKLPAEIGADKYGNPISSEIEWSAVPKFTFTPATTTP